MPKIAVCHADNLAVLRGLPELILMRSAVIII